MSTTYIPLQGPSLSEMSIAEAGDACAEKAIRAFWETLEALRAQGADVSAVEAIVSEEGGRIWPPRNLDEDDD